MKQVFKEVLEKKVANFTRQAVLSLTNIEEQITVLITQS